MWRAIFSVVLVLAWTDVPAAPPTPNEKQAKSLARKAKRAARKGDWGEAARLYGEAEELDQIFDYPWAIAQGHRDNGLLVLAWRALDRAENYGVPDRKRRQFDRVRTEIESELLMGHAYIELTDLPDNADVRINGRQWLPPFSKWVDRHFSNIVIEHPEYLKSEFNWHHMKGKKHTRAVTLRSKLEFGRIRITGSPDGAAVLVDGNEIGKLPAAETEWLEPGTYEVKIVAGPEWMGTKQTATVTAAKTTDVTIVLEPSQSDFEKLMASKSFWGWTFTGTGAALTITGAALLGVAAGRQSDVEALNATHPGDVGNYSEYSKQYDDTAGGISGLSTGGHVMLWIGVAMAGTGTALLLLDRSDGDAADGGASTPSIPGLVRF